MLSNSPFKGPRGKAYFALAWVSIFWGTTWLASKVAVSNMPALQMIGFRQLLGGLMFVSFFLFKKESLPKGKQWFIILIMSCLNFMISNGFVIWAVRYIPSGLGAIIGAIFPLWLVIITMFQGKRIPLMALIGILLGFGGVCVIFYEHIQDFFNVDFRFGIMLSLIASVAWAFGTLFTQKNAKDFNPYFGIGIQMTISSLVFLSYAYASGNAIELSAIPSKVWWSILYLITIGSTATFVAYIYALKHLPISLTSVYAYINPIVAVLLGAFVLDEKITIFIIAGGLLALLGVYLVNSSFRKSVSAS
ncbi:EamA family transporter [Ferruginibacter lapsinanis]|uniref:DMT family transporter n=1 Tax=Ferruginibacter lapsinanis TaxID=563172 RepID=UPI001E5DE567|nr:EamA family transporter [Ferruginibacter lapsinanis]UEG51334.1 EamA family transporter [Ferruginibacter lapsinanis]